MRLSLAISPCPNDTFMFDALVNGRIDTRGVEFDLRFGDIEELNGNVMDSAAARPPDISKISYAVLPVIASRYDLLNSGSALGHGNGPLLVARPEVVSRLHAGAAGDLRVAVPGIHTTANLLLQRLFPQLTDRRAMLFSDIASAIVRGDVDAGVLIHEGRFTYRRHGLELATDLGVEWERATGLPLPLGAIVASRTLSADVRRTVEDLVRESVAYAFDHPHASREFVKSHAREMDDEVIESHIALFVNENSLSLSPAARLAVKELTGIRAGA